MTAAADRRTTLFDKVMARVHVTASGCYLWTGPDSGDGRGGGYPRMNVDAAIAAKFNATSEKVGLVTRLAAPARERDTMTA